MNLVFCPESLFSLIGPVLGLWTRKAFEEGSVGFEEEYVLPLVIVLDPPNEHGQVFVLSLGGGVFMGFPWSPPRILHALSHLEVQENDLARLRCGHLEEVRVASFDDP